MKKSLFKRVLSCVLAAILSFSALAAALPALAAKEVPLHNEQTYYDFSEMNLVTGTSKLVSDAYWREYDDGGYDDTAVGYFASWRGPVDEASDPYRSWGDIEHKELSSVLYLEKAVNILNTVDAVKQAVMDYGALYCSFTYDDEYSDGETNFCLPLSAYEEMESSENLSYHAVAVVGWDDNYPKENFPIPPANDGAIICKNSWGTYSGDDGYCYISYEDMIFDFFYTSEFHAYVAEDADCDYNKIYQYDEFGAFSTVDALYDDIEYAANVFPEEGRTLESDEILKAVSFYTYENLTSYTVYLVEDYEKPEDLKIGMFNRKAKKIASGTMNEPGYYVLDLDKDYALKKGTRYAVAVKLEHVFSFLESYACESSHSKDVKGNKGESFYFAGNKIIDLNDSIKNSNWCIKAFTKYTPDTPSGSSAQALDKNISYFGIDNINRKYSDSEYYSIEELVQLGLKINPDYIEYIKNPDGRAIIPSPTVYSYTNADDLRSTEYPEKYDLRDYGYVSTVKDQGGLGSCWAHAAIASLESNALKKYQSSKGNGVFDSVKELKVRKEQTAVIDSAGDEAVYKFTSTHDDEYVFTVSGGRAKAELCTAFGIVVDEISGSPYKRYMLEGETIYLRVKFADAKTTGNIKVKADTQFLYDESSATEIKAGESISAVTSADEYQIYTITSEKSFDGYIEVLCDEKLEITLDGREIFPQEEPEFIYLYVDEEYPENNDVLILTVKSPSGGGTEYEITINPRGKEYIKNAVDISVGDICKVRADEYLSYRFVPAEDGYYGFYGAGYYYCDVYFSDGSEYLAETYRGSHIFLEKGKEYYFAICSDTGPSIVKLGKWDEAPSTEEIKENEVAYGTLCAENDTATFSFVAEEDGYYRFFFNHIEYIYNAVLVDENGEECADSNGFDGRYIYDYIKKGETRYLTVSCAEPGEGYGSLYGYYAFELTVEKRTAGNYKDDIPEIKQGTEFNISTNEMEAHYKFVPEKTEEYVVRLTHNSDTEYAFTYAELYDEGYNAIYNTWDFIDLNPRSRYIHFSEELTEGKIYYISFYAPNSENITVEILTRKEVETNIPDLIEPGKSYEFIALGGYENPTTIPLRVEGLGVDAFGKNLIFTFERGDSDFYGMPFFADDEYSLTPDGAPTEKDGVYYQKYEVTENSFDSYGLLYDGMDEELAFYGVFRFTVEIVEDEADFDYLSCSQNLNYKSWCQAEAYFSDAPEAKIIWSSSNEDVAVVDENGRVTAVGIGSAVITAKTEDGSREVYETVYVKYAWWQWIIRIILLGFIWY